MTHGTYSGYTRHGCRCMACTRANREYQNERNRRFRHTPTTLPAAHIPISEPSEPVERRVSGISGMTTGQVLSTSGVRVWCRNCGASEYANKWIVGKSRRIEGCVYCK